LTIESSVTKEL